MNFGRVEKEWETSPPAPQPYADIPSYSVQLQAGPGASAGMVGVHGAEQPPPIRIGRGASPASFMGTGTASLAAPNSGHKPTPAANNVSLVSMLSTRPEVFEQPEFMAHDIYHFKYTNIT